MSHADTYSYRLYSDAANYGITPQFIAGTMGDREGFASLYAVEEETAKAIYAETTTKQFKGVVWSERLWIDFDSYEAADRAESKLKEMGYDFIAYDTGGRGAHFGILRLTNPSHLLPYKDKAWVKKHFPEADPSIYTHLHPFRLPGTLHAKTGRRKQAVVAVEGKTLILPVYEDQYVVRTHDHYNGSGRSVFDCFRVMSNSHPVPSGERHATLVKLVYALRDDAKVGAGFAFDWAQQVNKQYDEPKAEHELDQIVKSIYGQHP